MQVFERAFWPALNPFVCSRQETFKRRKGVLYFLQLLVCKRFYPGESSGRLSENILILGLFCFPRMNFLADLKIKISVHCYILSAQHWEEVYRALNYETMKLTAVRGKGVKPHLPLLLRPHGEKMQRKAGEQWLSVS